MFHLRLKMCNLSEEDFYECVAGGVNKTVDRKLTLMKSISMHDPLMRAI